MNRQGIDGLALDPGAIDRVSAPLTPKRRGLRLGIPRPVLATGLALLLAVGGTIWIATPAAQESTDDAYVAADSTSVAPRVNGFVEAVLVHDNERVQAGQPLIRIDPEEFDSRVQQAQAIRQAAQAVRDQAQAALTRLDAEEKLAASRIMAAETVIGSVEAEKTRARSDGRRYDDLVTTGAASQRDADSARATAIAATQNMARALAELQIARDEAAVTQARRPGLAADLAKAGADLVAAGAALDLALQNQRHTVILAPIDGVVGNRQAEPGDYVQPGTRLLTLVPVNALYVTANFKETQIARMRPGQKVRLTLDALPGESLRGTVDSLAPGSGSAFALLPFEPGTGNFTKIVQRVPVRIQLDAGQKNALLLRAGLSVTATVLLKD